MSEASVCGDNSTECLLERMLALMEESNNQYNWNPATFYTTLAIGLIALFWSAFPVMQYIVTLAADSILSPRGYNERAIGRWAKKTTRVFSVSEMRLLAVVRTPLLDIKTMRIQEFFQTTNSAPVNELLSDQPHHKRTIVWRENLNSVKPYAGWLNLLRELSLDREEVVNLFQLTETAAEILPNEFPAAPAAGTVETITILAVMAGCNNLKVIDSYPFARGPGMQLDFRSHPTQGMVACFSLASRSGTFQNQTWKGTRNEAQRLDQTLQNSRGRLGYWNGSSYYPCEIDQQPEKSLPDLETLLGIFKNSHYCKPSLYSGETVLDGSHLPLLAASMPVDCNLFPSQKLNIHSWTSTFTVQSGFWRSLATYRKDREERDVMMMWDEIWRRECERFEIQWHQFTPSPKKNKPGIVGSRVDDSLESSWPI